MYSIVDKQTDKVLAYVTGSFRQATHKANKLGINATVKFVVDPNKSSFMNAVDESVKEYDAIQASL